MIDAQAIKSNTDCRQIAEQLFGEPAYSGGGAVKWACPFHGERNGTSLVVWETNWRCYGKCGDGGDVFSLVMKHKGCGFQDAVTFVAGDRIYLKQQKPQKMRRAELIPSPPPQDWQNSVAPVIDAARAELRENRQMMEYLLGRGLKYETIRMVGLGFIQSPDDSMMFKLPFDINMPYGITIPSMYNNQLWSVKCRRFGGLPKYMQASGGSSNGIYVPSRALDKCDTLILTEGEMDAIIAFQECARESIAVATLGSASKILSPYWMSKFTTYWNVFLVYDNDEAGRAGAKKISRIAPRYKQLQLPDCKDINEFCLTYPGQFREFILSAISDNSEDAK